ncbi:hypothetical protein [Cohnella fermenti]|uniref:Uncharacterized protein n=1 Tax=Cohnella fermenti TaxID=2565925 RepID=A0A4S4BTC7_9BACL|nr:hypothetical protein [Cohnella fermenti]THF78341.1 hypothetical protein E6C55_14070 [Cohnella fermenti]
MDKRLARTDILFALGFLFMLVVAVAAFFYGVQVGTERANDGTQQESAAAHEEVEASPNAYSLQDLVSFYHTVFLPYREFVNEWNEAERKWLSVESADRSSAIKELVKLASAQYDSAKIAYIPPVSPLLQEAQDDYLKSLKLYINSLSSFASSANEGTGSILLSQIKKDAFYKEAVKMALAGQTAYYRSMAKWASIVDMTTDYDSQAKTLLELSEWKSLPLITKNLLSAKYMEEQSLTGSFLPQDLTARIDGFLASGQAETMKLKTMGSVADLLTRTDAVRDGDFLQQKSRFYGSQMLPQLPFFSAS